MSSTSGSEVLLRKRPTHRRLSTPYEPRSSSLLTCSLLPPSLAALDLSSASPSPVLASVRVVVLSHLTELEESLAQPDFPSAESLLSKGEEKVEEVRVWASQALEMLRGIREDVCSHLPELPFDTPSVEDLKTRFHDLSYPSLVDDIRSHLPEMSIDFDHPMKYLPTLSFHLQSLHAHLSSIHSYAGPGFPSIPSMNTVSELLDKLLSSDLVPSVLHRENGRESTLEKAARDMSIALKKSLDGSRLVTYVDLPLEWRNNPFVSRGYRFIPLNRWHVILLSLFALHNETLNIHTHMIPLLHTALHFIPSLNYSSVSLGRPEMVYTAFAMVCLFSSVVWHTMSGCAHHRGMELCARVDYVGIGWLISASVGTVVYYGFSCHSRAAAMYLALCVITGVLGSIFPFMQWFNDRAYKNWRIAFFLGMAFTGLAPLAHLSYSYGFWQMLSFISPICPSLASYIIGLIFYVSHVPERFAYCSESISRWTDWLGGGSHAIWHAFIVLAIYQHKTGMRELGSGVSGEGCLM